MTKLKLAEKVIANPIKPPKTQWFNGLSSLLILASPIAAIAIISQPVPKASTDRISQPFPGVTYLNRRITGRSGLNMHIVNIDLTLPELRFEVTKPTPKGKTALETTLNYSQRVGAQIAINGNFFRFSPTARASVMGHAASHGQVYGNRGNSGLIGVNFNPNHKVSFLASISQSASALAPYNLLSGYNSISGGNVRADLLDNTQRAARSVIGVTQDGRQLVLLVVDGPASGVSRGMTQLEVAELLRKDFNVYNAANLDGGGSSTLVFCQSNCRLANVPSSTVTGLGDRVVGNNLAIFVPPAAQK
jgi:Phosphodiester glycosidase